MRHTGYSRYSKRFKEGLHHDSFLACAEAEVNRARNRMDSFHSGFALSILFSLSFPSDFFFPLLSPSVSRTLELQLPYLLEYYTRSSRNIKSARFHSVLSTVPASSAPPIGHARLPRQPMNASGLTALDTHEYSTREYRFRNTPALPTVSEIPCLKGGNYSKARARARAKKRSRRIALGRLSIVKRSIAVIWDLGKVISSSRR